VFVHSSVAGIEYIMREEAAPDTDPQ